MSKAVIATAFAVSLLYGSNAMAQQHDDHHGNGGGGGGAPHTSGGAPHGSGGSGGGAPHYSAPVGGGGGAPRTGGGQTYTGGQHTQSYTAPSYSGGGQYPRRGASQYTGGGAVQTQGYTHQQGGQYRTQGGQGASRGDDAYRGGGSNGPRGRYNEHDYPRAIQAERQFHWRGDWNPPRGFYYRHWGYGDRLPYGWFSRDFWIADFWAYGLPDAPYGYEWVREGPDAVLVNVYDGEVVEVEYGIFY